MIRVARPREPKRFDKDCRRKGRAWLRKNKDATRPKDYWTPFKPGLADAFGQLCAYSAMYEPVGTVDHFASWKRNPKLAYEWTNYRFASALLNSIKQTADDAVFDPFEVVDDWFEILLPSLQLVVTDRVPAAKREKAEDTLTRLRLRNDERLLRQRREWYRMYQDGEVTLEGLRGKVPLIARAVERAKKSRKKGSREGSSATPDG
jgi:hypothetical protein